MGHEKFFLLAILILKSACEISLASHYFHQIFQFLTIKRKICSLYDGDGVISPAKTVQFGEPRGEEGERNIEGM